MTKSKILLGLLGAAAVFAATPSQAAFVASLDFEVNGVGAPGVYGNFSGGGLQSSGTLGGATGSIYRTADATTMTFFLGGIGAHTALTYDFDLTFIDSWDGINGGYDPDYLDIKLDGVLIHTFSADIFGGDDQMTGLTGITQGQLGFNSGWEDIVAHLNFTAAHTASTATLQLNFYGAGAQYGDDESFGVDNMLVTSANAVPEPATWAMMIGGLGLVGLQMRRRKTAVSFA